MFIVTELQIAADNTAATINTAFTDISLAQNKYYTILAAACISNVYKHAAFLYTEDGYIAHECFTHVAEPVTPPEEPEVEPGGE